MQCIGMWLRWNEQQAVMRMKTGLGGTQGREVGEGVCGAPEDGPYRRRRMGDLVIV